MIVNETHRFAFIHIPKCAGTSIRIALLPFDEARARYYDKAVATHPQIGPLDHHHIPLALLREHFPEDFQRVADYRSFALVRDPAARFPSSLHERFVQRDRVPLADRAPEDVAREVDAVMAELTRLPGDTPVTDPALIHFSRQIDYVCLDGVQLVDTPRTVAEVNDVLNEISQIVGCPIRPEDQRNRRYHYAMPALQRLQKAVTGPIERTLPRWIWKPAYAPVKRVLFASGLIQQGRDPLAKLPNAAEIAAFIREFYAADIALFDRLDADRRARTDTNGGR